jgi:hypothetical protein
MLLQAVVRIRSKTPGIVVRTPILRAADEQQRNADGPPMQNGLLPGHPGRSA